MHDYVEEVASGAAPLCGETGSTPQASRRYALSKKLEEVICTPRLEFEETRRGSTHHAFVISQNTVYRTPEYLTGKFSN